MSTPEIIGTVTAMSAGLSLIVADAQDALDWIDPEQRQPEYGFESLEESFVSVLPREGGKGRGFACMFGANRGFRLRHENR